MNKLLKKIQKPAGFTLIELVVASSLFAILITLVASVTVNFYNIQRRQKISNELYGETRFLLERIIKEAREGTIDFEEYYSRSSDGPQNQGYGEAVREYENRFYYYTDASSRKNEFFFDTKADADIGNDNPSASALGDGNFEQKELYLLSGDGRTKTIFKLIGNGLDDDQNGTIDDGTEQDSGQEILAMAKMQVVDSNNDGSFDSWAADPRFESTSGELEFISITHPSMEIANLRFIVSPLEDPRKAIAEDDRSIQVQPHVTIILETRVASDKASSIIGSTPSITLQTMVSSRVNRNVVFPDS
jgi:prepilin-type N-terminal cleavage/methylation domain-containing protein